MVVVPFESCMFVGHLDQNEFVFGEGLGGGVAVVRVLMRSFRVFRLRAHLLFIMS